MPLSKIVILTGAGISQPAGIPTFQELYKPVITGDEPDSLKEILMNRISENLMHQIKQDINSYSPTKMHYEIRELLHRRYSRLTVFTTNIDDLHERSGVWALHIHGTVSDPVYFGSEPRYLEQFNAAVHEATKLIVIGSALAYPYLSIPISEWSMRQTKPALLLDTDPNHPLKNSFNHFSQEESFPAILAAYIAGRSTKKAAAND